MVNLTSFNFDDDIEDASGGVMNRQVAIKNMLFRFVSVGCNLQRTVSGNRKRDLVCNAA